MKNIIHDTAKYSLFTQIITGIIDILALQVNIDPKDKIIKELIGLELLVQIIEGIFYIWLVKSFNKVKNITKYRYYDWVFSTSIMLFTLIIYLIYLQETDKKLTIYEIYKENEKVINQVLSINLLMLLIGYLGEIKKIDKYKSVNIGFIPFIIYYKIIYENFVSEDILNIKNISLENKDQIRQLFWYFFIFWSLYGIAAYMPYKTKNISYNILDLFSKNFFGLFLSYQLYKKRIN